MTVHIASIQLVNVNSDTGKIFQRGGNTLTINGVDASAQNVSIGETLRFSTEHRVIRDPDIPNTANNPTVDDYIRAEDASGFTLVHLDQYKIITSVPAAEANIASGTLILADGNSLIDANGELEVIPETNAEITAQETSLYAGQIGFANWVFEVDSHTGAPIFTVGLEASIDPGDGTPVWFRVANIEINDPSNGQTFISNFRVPANSVNFRLASQSSEQTTLDAGNNITPKSAIHFASI